MSPRDAKLFLAAMLAACLAVALAACGQGAAETHPDAMAASLCGSPTACNDDAAMSTPAGTCFVADAAPPYSYCECAEGFSQNPKTGLCPGTRLRDGRARHASPLTSRLPSALGRPVPAPEAGEHERGRAEARAARAHAKIFPGLSSSCGSHNRLRRFCQSMTSADCSQAM
jgi:hypothetical protein